MSRPIRFPRPLLRSLPILALCAAWASPAPAMPGFARQYQVSCNTCHAAYPRLNSFGAQFADDMNYRLPNWPDQTVQVGDELLKLPKQLPLGIRAQAYVQGRDGRSIDPISGQTAAEADLDLQAPYLVKLLASAPLSDHISFYAYAIFAEKGGNGDVVLEDAWFSHDDLFGSRVSLQLGQFQVSDLMFPRETRMTFQDFMAYRFAGITYDRGLLFGRALGPVDLSLGLVNGNGIEQNYNLTSPGYRRPDHLFDNDGGKSVFGRASVLLGGMDLGLFALSGEQRNATGPAGMDPGNRDTDKRVLGVDASGRLGEKWHLFGQVLWNRWEGFLDPALNYDWTAAFAGVDYVHNDRWTYSALVNLSDAGDLENTDTVYEGIEMRTVSFTASYYFMRNVKALVEVNLDLLDKKARTGDYFTGHLDKENYILFGFDAAF